jgi:hypothetical protein
MPSPLDPVLEGHAALAGAPRPRTLDSIVLDLRQLALVALDGGQPMAAVLIAGTADRLEARIPPLPPRPVYA